MYVRDKSLDRVDVNEFGSANLPLTIGRVEKEKRESGTSQERVGKASRNEARGIVTI